MPEIKRVTLHPLNPDGSIDENINLYPKSMVSGLVDDEGNPMPGKGLSTNDYTNEDKNLLDALGRSVELYQYVYAGLADQQSITLPLIVGSPKNVIREISAKGKPDSASGVYHFDPTAFVIRSLPPFFLFSSGESFDLYQTGLQENITTNKYAYDEVNLSLGKIYRYCRPITLGDLIKAFPSTEWNWTGTAGNGRLSISHLNLETLNITALGWTNDELKVENRTDDLIFRSLSSTNFTIENCKNIEGVTNKATAIAALQDSETLIIFKAVNEWMEDFSQYNLVVAEDSYTGSIILPTSDLFTCMQVSYQSLTELVYSKEQTDAKFLSRVDNKGILILPDTIASADIYTELADLHYPAIAYANFTDGNDGTVPFTSHTFFINDKRNGSYGYIVISNGAHYWFKVYNDVVTLENIYQVDSEILLMSSDHSDFDDGSNYNPNKLPKRNVTNEGYLSEWIALIKKICKRGYVNDGPADNVMIAESYPIIWASSDSDVGNAGLAYLKRNGILVSIRTDIESGDYKYQETDLTSGGGGGTTFYKHYLQFEMTESFDHWIRCCVWSSKQTLTLNDIISSDFMVGIPINEYDVNTDQTVGSGMISDIYTNNNRIYFVIQYNGDFSHDIPCYTSFEDISTAI